MNRAQYEDRLAKLQKKHRADRIAAGIKHLNEASKLRAQFRNSESKAKKARPRVVCSFCGETYAGRQATDGAIWFPWTHKHYNGNHCMGSEMPAENYFVVD